MIKNDGKSPKPQAGRQRTNLLGRIMLIILVLLLAVAAVIAAIVAAWWLAIQITQEESWQAIYFIHHSVCADVHSVQCALLSDAN